MLTTLRNHGAMSTTLPAAARPSRMGRPPAGVVRLVIQAIMAAAGVALAVGTGWLMPSQTTLVLAFGFVLWLAGNFAAEVAPVRPSRNPAPWPRGAKDG